ncbi:tail fiber domain-containing protein [Leclercia sp.]|uniref:tail fiber domain-containing protein n=1 Tax=Leclercia sp. TaxID=1898428 RepID=UPI00289B6A90|nr:tail fiber domain-containing protein [Leclercia sp.]
MTLRNDNITLTAADVKALSADGGTVNGNVRLSNKLDSATGATGILYQEAKNSGGAVLASSRAYAERRADGYNWYTLAVANPANTAEAYYGFRSDGYFTIDGRISSGPPKATGWWDSMQPSVAGCYMNMTTDGGGVGAITAMTWGYRHNGGYELRSSWSNVGNGTTRWAHTVLTQFGDNSSAGTRYWMFDPTGGDLSVNGGGSFSGNYVFQKAATSDATLKHDIAYDDGKASYENIRKLKPCTFVYNGDYLERVRRGIIAQDALRDIDSEYVKLVPAAPEFDEEGNRCDKDDTLALDNNVIQMDTALALHHAIAKIEALNTQVAQLQAEVQALKA